MRGGCHLKKIGIVFTPRTYTIDCIKKVDQGTGAFYSGCWTLSGFNRLCPWTYDELAFYHFEIMELDVSQRKA